MVWCEASLEVVVAYLFLSAAIVFEVVATSFLRFTAGERATWWSYPIVACGYVLAFVALALALGRGIPLGIAYAVWAGVGVVLVALVSRFAFAETLTGAQLVGIGLVVAGVSCSSSAADTRAEASVHMSSRTCLFRYVMIRRPARPRRLRRGRAAG